MSRGWLDTLKEWGPAVPGTLYRIVLNVLPIIPFVTGVALAIRDSTKGIPVPVWVWGIMIGGALAFVVVSFLAFHGVRVERDSERREESRRQERKELRQRFSNVTLIPGVLSDMYDIAKSLCEAKRVPLTGEYWDEIAGTFFDGGLAPAGVPVVDKIPRIEELVNMINSTPDPWGIGGSVMENMNRLILNIQGAMSRHGVGAIPLTRNSIMYGAKEMELKLLQANLPSEVNAKIGSCVSVSNGLASLMCVDFKRTEAKIPEGVLVYLEYMVTSMDYLADRMRSEVAGMIERFLLGE
jgi:hypothetical protein